MIVSLLAGLMGNSGLLQQIAFDISASNLPTQTKFDSYKFSESRRVVVSNCLSIPESFKNWIGLQNFLLQGSHLTNDFAFCRDRSQILNDLLGVFRLSSSRLSCNQNGLVLSILQHVVVRCIRNGKNMWGHFVSSLILVHLNHLIGVDGQSMVWINCDQKKSRVCLAWIMHEREELLRR